MGHNIAHDLANEDFGLTLEQTLSIHLTSNHYPPVPNNMVPVCVEAIHLANEGEWEARVNLPDGVSWRDETSAPVWAIIEGHHLEAWLGEADE